MIYLMYYYQKRWSKIWINGYKYCSKINWRSSRIKTRVVIGVVEKSKQKLLSDGTDIKELTKKLIEKRKPIKIHIENDEYESDESETKLTGGEEESKRGYKINDDDDTIDLENVLFSNDDDKPLKRNDEEYITTSSQIDKEEKEIEEKRELEIYTNIIIRYDDDIKTLEEINK